MIALVSSHTSDFDLRIAEHFPIEEKVPSGHNFFFTFSFIGKSLCDSFFKILYVGWDECDHFNDKDLILRGTGLLKSISFRVSRSFPTLSPLSVSLWCFNLVQILKNNTESGSKWVVGHDFTNDCYLLSGFYLNLPFLLFWFCILLGSLGNVDWNVILITIDSSWDTSHKQFNILLDFYILADKPINTVHFEISMII